MNRCICAKPVTKRRCSDDMLAIVLTLLSVALSASTLNLKPLECQVVTDPHQKFHVAPSPTTPGSRELV
jgi:hypothetical protein